jgi:hypothetical protein
MVARLLRDWASSGRVDVRTQNQLLGEILFRAAFPGEIGSNLRDLLSSKKEQPLRIALHFQEGTEKHLVTLPWEHLFVPQDDGAGIYLAETSHVSVVRCREDKPGTDESLQRADLSVLMVAVQPPKAKRLHFGEDEHPDFNATDIDNVTLRARRLNEDVTGLALDVVEPSDAEELATTIGERDDQVVHVISYGWFNRSAGEGAPSEELVADFTFEALVGTLQRGDPQLVVLQLLRADDQLVAPDFALLAPTLIAKSIGSVVAYQYPAGSDCAAKFNAALYKELAGGASIDEAVQTARSSVYLSTQASREFISPALFVNRPGEKRLVAAGVAVSQRVGVGAGAFQP